MRKKIILSFVIMTAFTIGLFLLCFSAITHHDLYQSQEEKMIAQANAVSIEDVFPVDLLINRQISDYSNVIINAYASKNMKVSVFDQKGRMIQSSDGLLEDKIDQQAKVMRQTSKQTSEIIQIREKEKFLLVYWKLTYKGQQIAVLRFEKTLHQVDLIYWKLLKKALVVSGVIFLLSIVLSLVLAEKIVRPFQEIIRFIQEMTDGNYKEKLVKNYKDEAGKIVETLNFMGDEIQRKNKERYDFISSISHELKTPLTAIYGWTETLQEQEKLTIEEQKLGISVIRQESQRLSQMVDNLLYFSKNEAERSKLIPQQIDINHFAKSVLSFMKIRSDEKQINLKFHTTEATMYADENKMRQVFVNLIENAVKFSPPHTEVEISVFSEGDMLGIRFLDHGIGIDKEELEHITKAFYKISPGSQGEGLGLAVCSNIIELHKGRFTVESKRGKGTCVQIEIPKK